MELPLWIIAIIMVVNTVTKAVIGATRIYAVRSRYGDRTWIKKSINWVLNGQYE